MLSLAASDRQEDQYFDLIGDPGCVPAEITSTHVKQVAHRIRDRLRVILTADAVRPPMAVQELIKYRPATQKRFPPPIGTEPERKKNGSAVS